MKTKLKIFLIVVSAISLVAGYSFGAIVPITSITATGSSGSGLINLTSVTVGSYTISVDYLVNGTSSGTQGNATYPMSNADNFNIDSFANANPHDIKLFGGATNWYDTNGNNPDFFIFENGGNDSGTIRAILPGGTLGQTISFNNTTDWGATGFTSSVGGQSIEGLAFSITDLKDASGAFLTNSSVISGIQIASSGLDPSSISVVATPIPAAAWLLGTGLVGLIAIKRRRRS